MYCIYRYRGDIYKLKLVLFKLLLPEKKTFKTTYILKVFCSTVTLRRETSDYSFRNVCFVPGRPDDWKNHPTLGKSSQNSKKKAKKWKTIYINNSNWKPKTSIPKNFWNFTILKTNLALKLFFGQKCKNAQRKKCPKSCHIWRLLIPKLFAWALEK